MDEGDLGFAHPEGQAVKADATRSEWVYARTAILSRTKSGNTNSVRARSLAANAKRLAEIMLKSSDRAGGGTIRRKVAL
jgi:hypothetical protein